MTAVQNADAVVYFLPPSPSDTNPPLGPAILAQAARSHGFEVVVRDLNIEFIRRFRDVSKRETYSAVGDHGKDRALVQSSAAHLFELYHLDPDERIHVPDTADANAGMHFSERAIADAVRNHLADDTELSRWLEDVLSADGPPKQVLGVSVMGPSQVLPTLILLALAKRKSPHLRVAVGGSHATLLGRSAQGWMFADHVLVGHAEEAFIRLLRGGVVAPTPAGLVDVGPNFEYQPLFDVDQLSRYSQEALTLPVQFTRGCVYGRCNYCTYPVVEPVSTGLWTIHAVEAMQDLRDLHSCSRFSLKDSLFTDPMLTALSEQIIARSEDDLSWSATTKLTRAMAGKAALYAKGGLRTLEFGVESIWPKTQELIDKRVSVGDVELVVRAMADAGIVSVVNLMFGFPGESIQDAERQLAWALALQEDVGHELVDFSLNMVELVRGSPMERDKERYPRFGIAPFAFAYDWDSPKWRSAFSASLRDAESRV